MSIEKKDPSDVTEIAAESRGFAKEFCNFSQKGSMLFIHKHGDLDAVLKGFDVITRASVKDWHKDAVVIVKGVRGLSEGHYFLGAVGLRGKVANVYLEKIGDIGYLISMCSTLLS